VTKDDLLTMMLSPKACAEAQAWVSAQDGDALAIALRCARIDWLIWLLGRHDPSAIPGFADRCAARASDESNAYAYKYGAYARTHAKLSRTSADVAGPTSYDAENAADYAATAARYCVYAAGGDHEDTRVAVGDEDFALLPVLAERTAQLQDLHTIATAFFTRTP